jgi:hypothetical protein
LQRSVGRGGPRIAVVNEHHAMADENVILDRDALANKGVARDFAPLADRCVFLDLNEGADLGLIANLASVEVDELGQSYILTKLYVRCDAYIRVHERDNSDLPVGI